MRRGYLRNKLLGVMLVLGLLLCNGCSLVFLGQNSKGNSGLAIGEKEDTTDNTQGVGSGSTGSETTGNSEVVSDALVDKMKFLEYVIDSFYMSEVPSGDVQTGIYKGMLEGLGDPYSCYYTAQEYKDLMESSSGIYCGIGAVVQQNVKTMLITIVKPYVNGPAYNAGMLPGDVIYMVNDIDVTGMDINAVVAMMRGEPGTQVKVTVVRDGVTEPVDLLITRAQIEVETIEHEMLDNKLGYITISEFDEVTVQQFKDAITGLKKDGMEGLIIDLRDNPGGLLDSVVKMLDYILPEGMIVYTQDKYGRTETYEGTNEDVLYMPLVVMINENSASASEIFAAAIQDYEAGVILGTTSFGKGIVQSIIPLTDGTAVKLTVARYYTPKGVCIHEIGVVPDIEVALNEELRQQVIITKEEDNQLQAAIEYLEDVLK